ncbi:ankyrin [Corynespora cassiicola Philippines]|uniref:Ankyrin n=1 Tax=Corynespora cassiicola Philippines TaxID=1448308 RepID=A0A2T2N2A5_CORCC|nr:ankyrin [Corynespora cassiicola Philippines]
MSPSKAEWEAEKSRMQEVCSQLKIKIPMRGREKQRLIDAMAAKGFIADEKCYHRQFKEWGWSGYQNKSGPLKKLTIVMSHRKKSNKTSKIYLWGKPVHDKDIKKALCRPGTHVSALELYGAPPDLTDGYTIRSPIEIDRTATLFPGLPFAVFERDFMQKQFNSSNMVSYIDPCVLGAAESSTVHEHVHQGTSYQPNDGTGISGTQAESGNTQQSQLVTNSALAALDDLIPTCVPNNSSSGPSSSNTEYFNSVETVPPLYRAVLYSVANGFAGLEESNIQEAIRFLQHQTSNQLINFIRNSPSYLSRAIAQNLFKGSIEVGDAQVVSWLLQDKALKIDPNKEVCSADGFRYTPIEWASSLSHRGVVEVLLQHGADVDKTWNDNLSVGHGALDSALLKLELGVSRVDPELVKMLLDASSDISTISLDFLMNLRLDELVLGATMRFMAKNHQAWYGLGAFTGAFQVLHEETCMRIVQIMVAHGLDMNQCTRNGYSIIELAAERGFLRLVQQLVNEGAIVTTDSLPCAVKSQNVDLVAFLMEKGAKINAVSRRLGSPLAAAVRSRNPDMINLCIRNGALSHILEGGQLSSLLEAASAAGSVEWIEYVMELGGDVRPADLGLALVMAIRDGHEEAAERLIKAGADIDVTTDHLGPPLFEALKRRNEKLVLLLLEYSASASYAIREPTIILATQWGRRDMVEELIKAGAEVNACCISRDGPSVFKNALAFAIENHDDDMVECLLGLGVDINHPESRRSRYTALRVAAQNQDRRMVHYLLERGADPNDSDALFASASGDLDIFKTLLDSFCNRYPAGSRPKKYGSATLSKAVKEGKENLVKLLLSHGVDANSVVFEVDANGMVPERGHCLSPFGTAIETPQLNRIQIVELFLDKACSPNQLVSVQYEWSHRRAMPMQSAFMLAISTHDTQLVELLLKRGADIHLPAKGTIRRTSLQTAVEVGDYRICEILLNLGAKVNAPAAPRGGRTALQLAAISGNLKIACLLLNEKAEVDAPAAVADGYTAIEGAALHNRLDMVQLLLDAGACSHGKDEDQIRKAADMARSFGSFVIADMLEEKIGLRQRPTEATEDGNGSEMNSGENGMELDYNDFLNAFE